MKKISTDLLFKDIEDVVRQRNSHLLSEKQERLEEATQQADIARSDVNARIESKEQYERQLNAQLLALQNVRERSETREERQAAAEGEYRWAQERLKAAQEQHWLVKQEDARLSQRYDTLALATPREDSNYEAHLKAYEQQVANIDKEVDRLALEIKALQRSAGDAASDELINMLYAQTTKLRGDKAALAIPVEDVSLKEERARHLAQMEGIRTELVALERQKQECQQAENEARAELEAIEARLQDLQDEPKRDRITKFTASEEIDRLKQELEVIRVTPTFEESAILQDEERAQDALAAVEAQVAAEVDEAKERFRESALAQSGEWDSFAQLTSGRAEAERLWDESVEAELAQIKAEVAPQLDEDIARLAEIKQKYRLRKPEKYEYLTPEEEHVLASTFTPEQRAFLERGGKLSVTTRKSFGSWLMYLGIGVVTVFLWILVLGDTDDPAKLISENIATSVGFVLATAVIIRLFRLKATVKMEQRPGSGTPYIDVPHSATNFKAFLEAQVKKMDLDEQLNALSLAEDTRRRVAEGREKLDAYVAQNFPDSSRIAPFIDAKSLQESVERWYRDALQASLGDSEWPSVLVESLRPFTSETENKHESRLRSRWESALIEQGLAEFVR